MAGTPPSGASPSRPITRVPLLGVNPAEECLDSPFDRRSEVYRHLAWEAAKEHAPLEQRRQPLWTVPNALTFLRLLLVPCLVLGWFAEDDAPRAHLLVALLFVLASLTDWLDGFIARKFEVATVFGAFLDPVADKLMVTAVLILLVVSPPPPITQQGMAMPVIIMCCREVTMSALREWAAAAGGAAHKAVKVNSLGKWKTALQMSSMSVLLFAKDATFTPAALAVLHLQPDRVTLVAFQLLWAAAALAVWSLGAYFSNVWRHFVVPQQRPRSKAA